MGLLEHPVHLVKDHGTGAELSRHRHAAAQVLAALETQVLHPIFAEHPDLDPSSPVYVWGPGAPYPGGAILVERHQDQAERDHSDRNPDGLLSSARLPPERIPPGEGLLVKDARVDKELAAIVTYFLRTTSAALIHTIWMVKGHGTEEEFVKYRLAVCYVLAAMGEEISWYIDDKYPDIDPKSPAFIGDRAIHEGRLYAEEHTDEPGRGQKEVQAPISEGAPPSPPESSPRKGTRMDKDIAARIAYISRSCAGLLRHTVWLVKQQGTEEEFVRYKKHMGVVLTELQTRVLDPIYAEHPTLDPKSSTYSGHPGERVVESYLQEDEGHLEDTTSSDDQNT